MKIATFNMNNINKRLANLLEWLCKTRPYVACLQELRQRIRNSLSLQFKKPGTALSGAAASLPALSSALRIYFCASTG